MLKNSRQLSWSSHFLSRPSRLCRVGISSSSSSGIGLMQPREAATGADPVCTSLINCVNPVVSFKLFFTTDCGDDLSPAPPRPTAYQAVEKVAADVRRLWNHC